MEFFKKRSVALVIAFFIVFGSTVSSTNIKLQSKCDEVTRLMETGVEYDGYVHPAILGQLNVLRGDMDNFLTLIPEEVDASALEENNYDLRNAIKYSYDSPSYLCWCYEEVVKDFNAVALQMEDMELTERQQNALDTYKAELEGIKKTLDESGYNEAVSEFRRELNQFPTKIFADIAGVYPPDYFK